MIIITAKKINNKKTIIITIRKIITVKIINLTVLISKKIHMDAEEIENAAVPTSNEYMGTPIHIIRTGLLNTKKNNRKIITISVHPSTPTTQYEGGGTQIEKEKETEKEKDSIPEKKIGEAQTETELKKYLKKVSKL